MKELFKTVPPKTRSVPKKPAKKANAKPQNDILNQLEAKSKFPLQDNGGIRQQPTDTFGR